METITVQSLSTDKKPVTSAQSHRSPVVQKKLDEANTALAELNEESLRMLGVKPGRSEQ
jgi:hypothetical protein